MEVDVVLVILLVAGFMLGVLRGALRQLIVLGAWLVTFLVAAYLRPTVGNFILSNNPRYTVEYAEMLAFVATFIILFGIAVAIIEIGGHTIHLSQRVAVDEVIGGFLMLGATVLAIATVVIALDTYYAGTPAPGATELDMARELHNALERSAIVQQMHVSLIPGLMALFRPLLPPDIPAIYA